MSTSERLLAIRDKIKKKAEEKKQEEKPLPEIQKTQVVQEREEIEENENHPQNEKLEDEVQHVSGMEDENEKKNNPKEGEGEEMEEEMENISLNNEEEKNNEALIKLKQFAQYMDVYTERRRKKYINGAMDLGVRYLYEILFECYNNKLVPLELLLSTKGRQITMQLDFIHKFSSNNLIDFNFERFLVTPLDHRRMSEMLILKKPEGYCLGERLYCVYKDVTEFYEEIYKMDENDYYALCHIIDKTYNRSQWENLTSEHLEVKAKQDHPPEEEDRVDTSSFFQLQPSPFFNMDSCKNQDGFYQGKRIQSFKHSSETFIEKYGKKVLAEKDKAEQVEDGDHSFNSEDEKTKKKGKSNKKEEQKDDDESAADRSDSIFDAAYLSSLSNNLFYDNSESISLNEMEKKRDHKLKIQKEEEQEEEEGERQNDDQEDQFYEDSSDEEVKKKKGNKEVKKKKSVKKSKKRSDKKKKAVKKDFISSESDQGENIFFEEEEQGEEGSFDDFSKKKVKKSYYDEDSSC